jgi:hypothetical protein
MIEIAIIAVLVGLPLVGGAMFYFLEDDDADTH